MNTTQLTLSAVTAITACTTLYALMLAPQEKSNNAGSADHQDNSWPTELCGALVNYYLRTPLSNTTVRLFVRSDRENAAMQKTGHDPNSTFTTKTASDGFFSIKIPSDVMNETVMQIDAPVSFPSSRAPAWSGGLVLWPFLKDIKSQQEKDKQHCPYIFVLTNVTISGHVYDFNKKPVLNSRVFLLEVYHTSDYEVEARVVQSTTTDTDGKFQFSDLSIGTYTIFCLPPVSNTTLAPTFLGGARNLGQAHVLELPRDYSDAITLILRNSEFRSSINVKLKCPDASDACSVFIAELSPQGLNEDIYEVSSAKNLDLRYDFLNEGEYRLRVWAKHRGAALLSGLAEFRLTGEEHTEKKSGGSFLVDNHDNVDSGTPVLQVDLQRPGFVRLSLVCSEDEVVKNNEKGSSQHQSCDSQALVDSVVLVGWDKTTRNTSPVAVFTRTEGSAHFTSEPLVPGRYVFMFYGSRKTPCIQEITVDGSSVDRLRPYLYVYPDQVASVEMRFGKECRSADGFVSWHKRPVAFAQVVVLRESEDVDLQLPLVVQTNVYGEWSVNGLMPGVYRVAAVPFLKNYQLRSDFRLRADILTSGVRVDLRKSEKASDVEVALLEP